MFDRLIELYEHYKAAQKEEPYHPDTVQALGMAFYQEWDAQKDNLAVLFEIPEEEFEYSLHRTLMPILMEKEDVMG